MRKQYDTNNSRQRMNGWLWLLGSLFIVGLCSQTYAVEYDTGTLEFSAKGQSMWGTGDALVSIDESYFLGTEWQDKTVGIDAYVEKIENPLYTTWKLAYGAWRALEPVKPSPEQWCHNVWLVGRVCVDTPAYITWKGLHWTWQNVLNPGPAPTPQYIDLATGASIDLTTSGKIGIQADFMVDSGSVAARADFTVTAELPDAPIKAGTFFSLSPSSTFASGTINTQSPGIEASINGVLELSGSVAAQACLLGNCIENETPLQPISYSPETNPPEEPYPLEIFSFDPNAGVSLFGESLIGGVESKPLVVSFNPFTYQMKVAIGDTVLIGDTVPPPTTEVADITFTLPDIATSGASVDGNPIKSSGSDTVINADVDLDGLFTMATWVPMSADITLLDKDIAGEHVEIAATIDLLDIDLGPTINLFQDFELTPTLMVDLAFDHQVQFQGGALVNGYSGAWDSLPNIAIFQDTTVTPTFWLEATLTNNTGVNFAIDLDLEALSGSITAQLGDFDLGDLLGEKFVEEDGSLGFGPLWDPAPILLGGEFGAFNLWSGSFAFTGFAPLLGSPFTLFVADSGSVPEPGTLLLMGIGLAMLCAMFRRRK